MDERKFVEQLQDRAREQEQLVKSVPFPGVFAFVIKWLSFHPWRLLIPLAFLLTLIFRLIIGPNYTNIILTIFRWI